MQLGFSLIELVATIMLIGILSAVAMPRFINLAGDAEKQVISTTRTSIDQTAEAVFYKALMQGKQTQASNLITIKNNNYPIAYGYPTAFDGIVPLLSIGTIDYYGRNRDNRVNDWVYQLRSFSGRNAIDIAAGERVGDQPAPTPESTACFMRYFQATAIDKARVETFLSGC